MANEEREAALPLDVVEWTAVLRALEVVMSFEPTGVRQLVAIEHAPDVLAVPPLCEHVLAIRRE